MNHTIACDWSSIVRVQGVKRGQAANRSGDRPKGSHHRAQPRPNAFHGVAVDLYRRLGRGHVHPRHDGRPEDDSRRDPRSDRWCSGRFTPSHRVGLSAARRAWTAILSKLAHLRGRRQFIQSHRAETRPVHAAHHMLSSQRSAPAYPGNNDSINSGA